MGVRIDGPRAVEPSGRAKARASWHGLTGRLCALVLCACGSDGDPAEPADAGAAARCQPDDPFGNVCASSGDGSEPADASAGASGGSGPTSPAAGTGGGASDAGDAGSAAWTQGPPVQVSAEPPRTLAFRSRSWPCRVDAAGDLVCRNAAGDWSLYQAGPYASVAIDYGFNGRGTVVALAADGSLSSWRMPTGTDRLCAPGDGCVADGVPPEGEFVAVSAGENLGCAIARDGTLACWGEDGSDAAATPPVGDGFIDLDSAGPLSCALRDDGEVLCWGDDFFLDGEPLPEPAVQVAVGDATMCALLQSGRVICDGFNSVRVPGEIELARIDMGGSGLCGLTAAGEIHCWGTAYVERITPPPGPYLDAVAETFNACALRGDGVVHCWGDDLGNGAGPETCRLTQALLTVDGGAERAFHAGERAWGDNVGAGATWGFVTELQTVDPDDEEVRSAGPLASIMGSPGGPSGRGTPRDLFDEGSTHAIGLSLWALEATPQGSGEITCSGPDSGSRVTRNGDELVFDMRSMATLGSCPGSPVTGQIGWCGSSGCSPDNVTATLDSTPYAAADSGWRSGQSSAHVELSDGSVLDFFGEWGLFITAPDSPFAGEVFCIGAASGSSDSWTFSDISSLGRCGSGEGSLTGCVR